VEAANLSFDFGSGNTFQGGDLGLQLGYPIGVGGPFRFKPFILLIELKQL
jgi:hypothetical protein